MAIKSEIYEQILKDCFWEYKFDEEKLRNLSKSSDFAEKKFLFGKILVNSTEFLSALGIFQVDDLKTLIEEFKVPEFNHDFIFRRKNMAEVYFLDKPLLIEELKWVI
ncbi:MAG: hypothetical protein H8E85_08215 [Candidatus Marinimicrobia bacterium]|nr:hypothetical protein [Candidatus Neomarinimicrobiota bacterium]